MRKIILKYTIILMLVLVSGSLLMSISHRVQRAEREIKQYDRIIAQEEESIRILKAEWAYLNDPARLEEIASDNLGFALPDTESLLSDTGDIFEEHYPETVPRKPFSYRSISYRHGGVR